MFTVIVSATSIFEGASVGALEGFKVNEAVEGSLEGDIDGDMDGDIVVVLIMEMGVFVG